MKGPAVTIVWTGRLAFAKIGALTVEWAAHLGGRIPTTSNFRTGPGGRVISNDWSGVDGMARVRMNSDAFPGLVPEWDSLVQSLSANPSLGPEWTRLIAASHGVRDRVEVVTWRDAAGVHTLIPYFTARATRFGVPVSCLELVSNLVSYHNRLLSRGNPREQVARFLDATRGTPWTVFRMQGLVEDSETHRALRDVARTRGYPALEVPGERSPFLRIAGTWDEYLQTRPRKFRYKVRQRAALVEREDVELRWYEGVDHVEELLQTMVAIEKKSWKSEAAVAIGANEIELAYHRLLLRFLATSGALSANVLFIGGVPAAYNLCCVDRGWHGQLKTSYDEAFRDLSPGGVVVDAAIKRAFDQGAAEFDYLGDDDSYKRQWTTDVRPHVSVEIYNARSLRGIVLGRLKQWAERRRRASEKPPAA